jgi:hypothetical protein
MLSSTKTTPRFSLVMTRNDDHLQSAGEPQKLEWVTPKILLMEVEDTEVKVTFITAEQQPCQPDPPGCRWIGPS